jgi:hypothetical protein
MFVGSLCVCLYMHARLPLTKLNSRSGPYLRSLNVSGTCGWVPHTTPHRASSCRKSQPKCCVQHILRMWAACFCCRALLSQIGRMACVRILYQNWSKAAAAPASTSVCVGPQRSAPRPPNTHLLRAGHRRCQWHCRPAQQTHNTEQQAPTPTFSMVTHAHTTCGEGRPAWGVKTSGRAGFGPPSLHWC